MKAALLTALRQPLEVTQVPSRDPGPGQVRIRIRASGICGTDIHAWHGDFSLPGLPVILGHEPVGVVESVGPGVTTVRVGDRVGVSWTQRGCGRCRRCQELRPVYCTDAVTWVQNGGGNAELMIAEAEGCTAIPEGVAWEEAAPIFCAGFTVMSGYRNAAPRGGDRVAILGVGGLGHLALQIAKAMGHETVAVTNSPDKAATLRGLGADEVMVVRDHVGRELAALGGVDIVLSSSNSMKQNGEALHGLRDEGRFVSMAIGTEPIAVDPNLALNRQLVLKGSMMNERRDLVEILDLVAARKVRPLVESYPLEDATLAFERMDRGLVRYRAVLDPGGDR